MSGCPLCDCLVIDIGEATFFADANVMIFVGDLGFIVQPQPNE
jgi:hypothetical protein